jgi:hypothetical protein
MAKPKFHYFMATKLQALLDKITALWLHFFSLEYAGELRIIVLIEEKGVIQ